MKLQDMESAAGIAGEGGAVGIKSVDDGGRARDPVAAVHPARGAAPEGRGVRHATCSAWRRRVAILMHALEMAKRQLPDSTRALQTVLKAAVAAGTTTDADVGGSVRGVQHARERVH